jgi:hypothetical protein
VISVPARVFGEPVKGENLYYFSPGEAGAKLSQIIPLLEKTGTLPAEVNLGAT